MVLRLLAVIWSCVWGALIATWIARGAMDMTIGLVCLVAHALAVGFYLGLEVGE